MKKQPASSEKYLVTSALPYANGPIHFGHIAGAYLPADVYVRYLRLAGADVVYVCGTDEHGVAVTITAAKQGVTPQQLVDRYHGEIGNTFRRFDISFDNFSRTTLPRHYEISREFFTTLLAKDLIEKDTTRQLYCTHDAMFLPDRYITGCCPKCGHEKARGDECPACGAWLDPLEIIDPVCTICGNAPEVRETVHWFLQLQKLQPRLEEWLAGKPHWKGNVTTFIDGMLKEGLRPRPVTRDLEWGIPVPLAEAAGKVLYVWFDAPIGYISSTVEWAEKLGDPERWKAYWLDPQCKLVHFIGKDNIPFHTIVFPAMLLGRGEDYVLPENVPANEFYNYEGRKFSTSTGWTVDIEQAYARYGGDMLRYAILASAPESKDSDFTWRGFQAAVNSGLADTLGNFINRSLVFAARYFDNRVPAAGRPSDRDQELQVLRREIAGGIGESIRTFGMRRALELLIGLAREGNRYFDEKAPWKSREADPADCAAAIHQCLQLGYGLGLLLRPFLPAAAARILAQFNRAVDEGLAWEAGGEALLAEGHALGKAEVLFRKVSDEEITAELETLAKLAAAAAPAVAAPGAGKAVPAAAATPSVAGKEEIVFEDFLKLDLRVGQVKSARRQEGSDKLLVLEVDCGDRVRQIVGGLGKFYEPEALVGRQVVVLANLAPRKLRKDLSEGMLLAADDGGSLRLLCPDAPAAPGSAIG